MNKLLFFLTFLVGCTSLNVPVNDVNLSEGSIIVNISEDVFDDVELSWFDTHLINVRTKESFAISDFSGKPVLLETFAVWCSKCLAQQNEIKKLHEELGDSFVSVTVDLDSSESEGKVLDFINGNGFSWVYSIDHNGFGKKLIDEFGINVANAPNAPVILKCPGKDAELLRFGVKNLEELRSGVESCSV